MTTPNGNEAAPAGQTATAHPEPGSFQLDPARSAVSITHKTIWGLVTVRGSFAKVSGSAEILPDSSGRGRLEIDASSLDTKNAKRDEHLRSKDFFNAADHAQIIVDLTEAARHGTDTVTATGTLTAAGQTRPLSLTAHLSDITAEAVTLTADTEINRADFGMTWNQLGMLKGNAHVSVTARFVRQPAS
jgi:polyisoprenoid-binding protein YceI